MTTKLFAAAALTALLVTASASADSSNQISSQTHSTEVQGDVDLTAIQNGQVQSVMGYNDAVQPAGTLFDDAVAVQGNVTSTVAQAFDQVRKAMGSNNSTVPNDGAIGIPK